MPRALPRRASPRLAVESRRRPAATVRRARAATRTEATLSAATRPCSNACAFVVDAHPDSACDWLLRDLHHRIVADVLPHLGRSRDFRVERAMPGQLGQRLGHYGPGPSGELLLFIDAANHRRAAAAAGSSLRVALATTILHALARAGHDPAGEVPDPEDRNFRAHAGVAADWLDSIAG